jgi:putative flavoprotein involved in K+ transport
VLLADGSRVQPDVVIAATGYRRGLEPLVGHLGMLDDKGTPLVTGGRQMRLMRFDARSITRALTS